MTAHKLIADIFARSQGGVAPNLRRITPDQLKYLRDLITKDAESGAVTRGSPGSLVWAPSGPDRFVVTEDLIGKKHTLMRLPKLEMGEESMLF